jgi:hypothetical protein
MLHETRAVGPVVRRHISQTHFGSMSGPFGRVLEDSTQ